jgi:dTDP-4-dehydrorhamnose reductase
VKIAVTGASGLLGAHLCEGLRRDHDVAGLDRNSWWGDRPLPLLRGDLGDPAFINKAVAELRPDVLVHCAGITDVDSCQKNPEQAFASNTHMTRDLVRHLSSSCHFVYVSTDSVFQGAAGYWTEESTPSPCNVYAQSKLGGEQQAAAHADTLTIRTNFYGWSSGRKKTAGEWLFHALDKGEDITLFTDFFFTPIYAVDLVEIVRTMIERRLLGVFHVAGRDRVSKYDFGSMMARRMAVTMDHVKRGSLADAKLAAPRSSDISLDSGKASHVLGRPIPDCEAGIARFLADRQKPLSERFTRNG